MAGEDERLDAVPIKAAEAVDVEGHARAPGTRTRCMRCIRRVYSTTFTMGWDDSARYRLSSCSRLVAVMVSVTPR